MCQGLLKDNDILNTVMNILRRCSKWDGCRNVSCQEQYGENNDDRGKFWENEGGEPRRGHRAMKRRTEGM